MLVARGEQWLLSVRGPGVDYAPGSLGLIGGHVEAVDFGADVLRATARRELWEEAGVDLPDTGLDYLESTLFGESTASGDGPRAQLSVTFVAVAPTRIDATVRAPAELTEVGWWTASDAAADPRCPPWLPPLLERAARLSR